METIKDILNFCNAAIFYDYKNVGITCDLNEVRKCIFNHFSIKQFHIVELLYVYL